MSTPPAVRSLREPTEEGAQAAAKIKPLSDISNFDLNFAQSEQHAKARLGQCLEFLASAQHVRFLLERYAQRSAGLFLTEEDMENRATFLQQWHGLLGGCSPKNAHEVLRKDFEDLATEQSARALKVAESWDNVTNMVEECKAIKAEVDGLFATLE